MVTQFHRTRNRSGIALLLCLFIIALTSMLVLSILDTGTSQLSAIRNTTDFEKALYLAGSAVHHGLAKLESDISWRGVVTEGTYPLDNSYSAEAIDGAAGSVVITGTGVSGSAKRTLQVTVSEGN